LRITAVTVSAGVLGLLLLATACTPGLRRLRGAAVELAPPADGPLHIATTTRVKPRVYDLPDGNDAGAVILGADDITVDFQGATLNGAPDGRSPDRYAGKGIVVRGRNVTLRNANVRGYQVGIYAEGATGLTITGCDVSDNYAQRLGSTIEREDGADWLYPHHNDDHEWMRYGAGIYLLDCDGATVRNCRARHTQNGIVLDRVSDARIYGNDCSFLSGWGLAMWRSSHNVITRNAFDFCVRGYSHGLYNRGQDSAGILMFEQCCNNIIAENSVTHGGDGIFAFAGREALGEAWMDAERQRLRAETGRENVDDLITVPAAVMEAARRRGNNGNLFIRNDLSHAAAHGLELTFSFDNRIIENRLIGNAICGLWGGYSQDTLVLGNIFEGNGEAGYGLERGGINIEHGRGNRVLANTFRDNACGIHLWSDDDGNLLKLPWALANHQGSTDNFIALNIFRGDKLAVHLRECANTVLAGNKFHDVPREIDATAGAEPVVRAEVEGEETPELWQAHQYPVCGETRLVGARARLAGRQNIVMTEWGPYDFSELRVSPAWISGGPSAKFHLLGPEGEFEITDAHGDVMVSPTSGPLPAALVVETTATGAVPFAVDFATGDGRATARGMLLNTQWNVSFYTWSPDVDPRGSADNWQRIIEQEPVDRLAVPALDFAWRGGRPTPNVPGDHFATVATTHVTLPAGKWRIRTVSDDGIRVFVDGHEALSNWTWHGPTPDEAVVELAAGPHDLRVEHFEIDGYAWLALTLEPPNEGTP